MIFSLSPSLSLSLSRALSLSLPLSLFLSLSRSLSRTHRHAHTHTHTHTHTHEQTHTHTLLFVHHVLRLHFMRGAGGERDQQSGVRKDACEEELSSLARYIPADVSSDK